MYAIYMYVYVNVYMYVYTLCINMLGVCNI